MIYSAKIIEDSISTGGHRLTTMQLTYPRYIHAEFMTHRVFSRNASSSRAIPTPKLISLALENMVFPIEYGLEQRGMQASETCLTGEKLKEVEQIWEELAKTCAKAAEKMNSIGLHKQWSNRCLEWFSTISIVVTATSWDNFFELRNHPDAQPEIQNLARIMRVALDESIPVAAHAKYWHLPYINQEERDNPDLSDLTRVKMSVARCARVSYLTHEGKVPSITNDLELFERLVGSVPLHASPCEHQGVPLAFPEYNKLAGNFVGWVQYRKLLEQEMYQC